MQDFRKLRVWEKAHELALAVYRGTRGFPREELYGLTSQLRRSAVSIPANIAEGSGRSGDKEFARFAQIAMGSASEVKYPTILAHDLGLMNKEAHEQLTSQVDEVQKMLSSLIRTLKSKS